MRCAARSDQSALGKAGDVRARHDEVIERSDFHQRQRSEP